MKNKYTDTHELIITEVSIRNLWKPQETLHIALQSEDNELFGLRLQTNKTEFSPVLGIIQSISPEFAQATLNKAPIPTRTAILKHTLGAGSFGLIGLKVLARLEKGNPDTRGGHYPDNVYIQGLSQPIEVTDEALIEELVAASHVTAEAGTDEEAPRI